MDDTQATNEVKKFLSRAGRKGGAVTKEKHGKEFYSKIGREGMKKRWGKTNKKQLAISKK